MKLHELKDESKSKSVQCDPCHDPGYITTRDFGGNRVVKLLGPAPPGHQILVQDESTGRVNRMVLGPDCHLGGVCD